MTATALLASDVSPEPSPPQPQRPDVQRIALEDAIALACRRIAPLWPLKHFVAVNPFLGFTGQSFGATCALMQRVTHARMLMPRSFYREAIEKGEIDDTALQEAIDGAAESVRQRMDLAALKAAAGTEPDAQRRPEAVVATVAEILDRLSGGDRHASHVAFMIDEISRFCAAYFDDGQASWPLPWRKLPLYRAWRESLRHDRSAEALGIRNFSKVVLALPVDPVATIGQVVAEAGIPHHAIEDYLHRALFDIGGWAAHARQLSWNAELHGSRDDTLVDLLALRIAWGWGLFRARTDAPFKAAWAEAMTNAAFCCRKPTRHPIAAGLPPSSPIVCGPAPSSVRHTGRPPRSFSASMCAPRSSAVPWRRLGRRSRPAGLPASSAFPSSTCGLATRRAGRTARSC
jgi:uncharacterized protein YbcC (UPF0753/DUF2309 family)